MDLSVRSVSSVSRDKVIIKSGRKHIFCNTQKIDWINAENGYIRIHFDDSTYLLKMSLKELEEKLDSDDFVRINRSEIVNINNVKELIDSENSTEMDVVLKNLTILKWSRRYRHKLNRFVTLK